jgi:hypothetical protein
MPRAVAASACALLVLLGVGVTSAARDDLNSWTLWSRNRDGTWTAGRMYLAGRRQCIERLDYVQHLYVGTNRSHGTVLLTPAGHSGTDGRLVYAPAGAATAGRSTRQSGMVVSTTSATIVSVAGTPVTSPTKPQMVGATAEAAIVAV